MSAGEKAKLAKGKAEERSVGKKGTTSQGKKKMSRKNSNELTSDSNVAIFAALDDEAGESTVDITNPATANGEAVSALDGASSTVDEAITSGKDGLSSASSQSQTKSGQVRPGITWQRYQNIIAPYVTGIAVRP